MHTGKYVSFPFDVSDAIRKTYIAISKMKRWNSFDNLFFLDEFYDNIVAMFEDNSGSSWVEETLAWWNEYFIFLFVRVFTTLLS